MAGPIAMFTDGQTEIWANEFELRRARGFQATISWLTFEVESFPGGFEVVGLSPGELTRAPRSPLAKVKSALRGSTSDTKELKRPERIKQVGAFAAAYVDRDGRTFGVEQTPCYVVAVEVVKWHNVDNPATLRLRFADARYLWDRGVLTRWSFNRLRADRSIAADSLNPSTGLPWNLFDAAAKVAADFPLAHELSHAPKDFASSTPQLDLPPGSQPIFGLATIVREHNLLAPCLRWDNSLALHRAGDGQLGWGKDNAKPFPEGYFPNLTGTEQGYRIEPTFRPEFVIVQGGPKVVTVAMDNAEPVLEDEAGNLEPITDDLIRRLTGGRFGLTWLHEVVLQPEDLQAIPGLSEGVQTIVKDQAYRLYRVPGVEVDSEVPLQVVDQETGELVDSPDRFVKKAGPHAHLLPVLPRAESTGAGRLAPTVETFAYGPVHRAVRGSMTEEELQALEIDKQLARQKAAIQAFIRGEDVNGETTVLGAVASVFQGQGDPWEGGRIGGLQLGPEVVAALLRHAQEVNRSEGNDQEAIFYLVSKEEFFALLKTARIVERIKEVSPGAASERAKLLTQKYTLRDVFSPDPGWGPIFTLCLRIAALETQLNERRNRLVGAVRSSTEDRASETLAESPDLNESIVSEVLKVARAVTAERRKRQLLTDVGAVNQGTTTPIVAFQNKFSRSFVSVDGGREERIVRDVDTGATLVDPKRGLFKVSRLPGHLVDPGVPVDEASTFVPKPVRLIFGAVARPRVDEIVPGRPTGDAARATVASDAESLYESWWERTGAGALNKVDPARLSPARYAEIRRQAIPLQRPDLFELVPLEGRSNVDELDKEARPAAGAMLEGAERIESAAWTVARPFAVECDGVVSAVTVRSRPGGLGIETVIETGDEPILSEPLRTSTRQQPRFKQGDPSREGGVS